ncbi:MAG TPA: anthrone oxygenase family protein [Chloroflexia bacterium]|nr:anthrone oxygenase family protein [Chloroflexia bacterium]
MESAVDWLYVLTLLTALGSGLMAGVFFAFSSFVMKALARLSPAEGIAAMQSINITVINPLFMAVFLGTAVAGLVVAVAALLRWNEPGAAYLLLGGALYLVGCFVVTGAFNVPRNNALAATAPGDPNAHRLWADYLSRWTAWNHVRTAASLAAAAVLTIALAS